MPISWTQRVYTAGEAANLAGIRRGTLDIWTIRLPAELFSEKRGSRRWFSQRDIAVIAMAHQLERAGLTLLTAVAMAYNHLEGGPPSADAILVVPAGTTASVAGRFIADRDVARLPIDKTLILIPAGHMVAGITAACASLRERAA